MTLLRHVDPNAAFLTTEEKIALHMMLDKIERYVAKGRVRETFAARTMVYILWQALTKEQNIDTGWGEL